MESWMESWQKGGGSRKVFGQLEEACEYDS